MKFAVLILTVLLSACAAIVPNSYLVERNELEQSLSRKFPLEKGQDLFRVKLTQPALAMLPGQNRVRMSCNFSGASKLGMHLDGRIEASAGLRYDPVGRQVVLQDVQLDRMESSLGATLIEAIRPGINAILGNVLRDYPVRQFNADELKFAGVPLEITSLTVEQQGIRLGLHARQ